MDDKIINLKELSILDKQKQPNEEADRSHKDN